jgi:hypothetical protein
MRSELATAITGKRFVLLAVADLLTAAAALAIGILLFGDFGSTEGRILATTALLAGYGLFALPAAVLRDQRRLAALTIACGVRKYDLAATRALPDAGEFTHPTRIAEVDQWMDLRQRLLLPEPS